MATDSVSWRVAQKEVQLFFVSSVVWLFFVCFIVVSLFVFFWVELFFVCNVVDVRFLFEWMLVLLIFLSVVFIMRMWSEEWCNGTFEYVFI